MPGRKPKPTKLKLLQGNPGHRPLNQNEPEPKTEIPEPPGHLTVGALTEWNRISQQLFNLGLLSGIDRTELAMYCQAYDRWVEAEKVIEEKGVLYKTKSGNVMTSPMLWVANKAMDQCHKFLTEFGMTPSSRSRVSAQSMNQEKDSWSAFD